MIKSLVLTTLFFASSAMAFDFRCITKEEAVTVANENIESLRVELRNQSSYWVQRQKIREYIGRMDFDENQRMYTTGVLAKWTCAPGADCYAGISVNCFGEAGIYQYAD